MSTTRETVETFFARFGAGAPDLLDLFADTVDFDVPGAPTVPWTGPRTTKAEVAGFFPLFGEYLTPAEEFTLTGVLVDGDDAVATGRCVFGVISTGKTFTNAFALHFTIDNGKIIRYHMHEDSHAIATAFAP
ncbi:hypothetical protein GCM10027589_24570 [Actinocorallia lasiicapitis]